MLGPAVPEVVAVGAGTGVAGDPDSVVLGTPLVVGIMEMTMGLVPNVMGSGSETEIVWGVGASADEGGPAEMTGPPGVMPLRTEAETEGKLGVLAGSDLLVRPRMQKKRPFRRLVTCT